MISPYKQKFPPPDHGEEGYQLHYHYGLKQKFFIAQFRIGKITDFTLNPHPDYP